MSLVAFGCEAGGEWRRGFLASGYAEYVAFLLGDMVIILFMTLRRCVLVVVMCFERRVMKLRSWLFQITSSIREH